jgi:hypothetical protein
MFLAFIAVVSLVPLFYTGCGVNNPNEPNWGYPTPTVPPPTNTPTVTMSPTITPTGMPTATPMPGYYFSSAASITGWNYNASGSTAGVSVTTGFNPSASCSPNMGALEVTIGFTATSQQANIQYNLGTATNLAGKNISSVISFASGFNATYPQGGYVFVQDGAGQSWASSYSNWINAGPGCVALTYSVPGAVVGNFDPTQVVLIGVQINTNGSGTASQAIVDIFNWNY